jgi:hypothetical protein
VLENEVEIEEEIEMLSPGAKLLIGGFCALCGISMVLIVPAGTESRSTYGVAVFCGLLVLLLWVKGGVRRFLESVFASLFVVFIGGNLCV